MCRLIKCCVNCKCYEHIRELDNEVDWCNYHKCSISDDPEYVKSEMSGNCAYYERLEYKQYVAEPPTLYNLTHIEPDTWYDVIDCKQLIKEINEKIARKIMINSVYGKAAFDNDPICTEPSIVDQYFNKKRATYEREREDAIQKINEASPVGKAITNFIAALKKAGLKDKMLPTFNLLWNDNCLTDAEKVAIEEIHTAYHIAMTNLQEKCRECVAILVNCETFEQKMTVLQKYDIIDSDYKLKA